MTLVTGFEPILDFPALPLWAGTQSTAGNQKFLPFSLGQDPNGFIRQTSPSSVRDEVVAAYSDDSYQFITPPPGESAWADELGDYSAAFGATVLGSYPPQQVLEIGAGSTAVARNLLVRFPIERYVIADPAVVVGPSPLPDGLELMRKYFSAAEMDDMKFDAIFSFNCLEHIPDPGTILRDIRAVASSKDARIGLIFPETRRQLAVGDFNVLLHEHLNYFTTASIRRLFTNAGFSIIDMQIVRDEVQVILKPADRDDAETPEDMSVDKALLANRFEKSLAGAEKLFHQALSEHGCVAIHGATNGLNTVLSLLGFADDPRFIIFDGDESKVGRYLPANPLPIRHSGDSTYQEMKSVLVAATSFFDPIYQHVTARVGIPGERVLPLFPLHDADMDEFGL